MWNNDDEVNDHGDPVELYLPAQGPPRKTNIAPRDSHIGGLPCFNESFIPCCDVCGDKMFLLTQLQLEFEAELERHLCVFSCTKEDCFGEIVYHKGFASSSEGVNGVVKCIEKRVPIANSDRKINPTVATPSKSSWYDDDDNDSNNDNDWGMGNDHENINLENAVAAMESKLDDEGAIVMTTPSKKPTSMSNKPSSSSDEALRNAFKCYLLKKQKEPPSSKSFMEDEDDVGLSESDEKIRNMLARYMAEEEDEDILAALGGTAMGGGGNSNNGEEDERLSEEDRVLRTFQDRQKRAARQVIRYAKGGKPLWSIPGKNRKSGKALWSVPKCSDGSAATFEFQVLPSILIALEVDQHPATRASAETTNGEKPMALDQMLSNGINFGSIAVFTNPATPREESEGENDAFVVIQKSVDDLPEQGGPRNNTADCGEGFPVASMAVVEDLDDDEEFELDA
eukprot:CAMPEP_0197195168 /NCGR_PEP_ID=MMETSP1423-20130617/30571_1 /TAXON_ID=476441 /ORGANISM="Pseudo-nitzschia heimii, Strain UNC1101" /LENGTH=453 /DNA_ID=CAMNT_0042648735 /DNA_START=70 /DNA_END=1431 /DNA_ORIENTATION=+